MKNKLIKLIATFSLFSFLIPLSISCTQETKNEIKYRKTIEVNANEEKWNSFVNQKHIQYILNKLYSNEQEINDYINSQKEINVNEYLKNLKTWFRYANNIIRPHDRGRFDFQTFKTLRNFTTQKGDEAISKLLTENWLFYLFNIDKFKFIQYPDIQTDEFAIQDNQDEVESKQKIFSDFYSPESNLILDYVIQERVNKEVDEDEENYKKIEERIYFLTNEGYIFRLDLEVKINKDKKIIIKNEVFQYINTYPKLLISENKLNNFSLNEYIRSTQDWPSANLTYSGATKSNFDELNGGRNIRYTLIDANN
ncbi:aromatic motif membrane protein [Mycoplasmopsis felis]|uniref:aromatic motif membrane protein n=1 Tax=Mycoplasmopsis felis TaxID=33923 RepID=UPI00300D0BEE